MTAKIIVKCIIYNRTLNRFLLVQRCENDYTGANTWENAGGNNQGGFAGGNPPDMNGGQTANA